MKIKLILINTNINKKINELIIKDPRETWRDAVKYTIKDIEIN